MTYAEAWNVTASDKPDLRFGMELVNISEQVESAIQCIRNAVQTGGSVRLINVPGGSGMTRKEIDSLAEYIKTYRAKGLAWLTCDKEPRDPS